MDGNVFKKINPMSRTILIWEMPNKYLTEERKVEVFA